MPVLRNNLFALNQLCRVSPGNGETKMSAYETPIPKGNPRNPWILIAVHIYIELAEATLCHFAHSLTRHAQLRRRRTSKKTDLVSRTVQPSYLGGEIIFRSRDST
jgi:hypothetical protein